MTAVDVIADQMRTDLARADASIAQAVWERNTMIAIWRSSAALGDRVVQAALDEVMGESK